ncbi:MAG: tetratricopeptide repeat protein [Candidatus Latescibacterota bacterium]|nr:MAG: tetratricopeptide repeat protein [Candidatus Latescibacterota bacterium]
MRKTSTVYMGLIYALLVAGLATGVGSLWAPASLANPVSSAAGEGYSSQPTMGGEPAFATKADGMVSTIESHMQSKNFEAASKAALELTEYYPQYVQGWMLLGYCRSMIDDFAGSNEAYEKALSLGVAPEAVYSRKAYNHIRLAQFDDAKACYRLILETKGEDFEALKQIAFLEGKLGNLNAASHYYRRAMELDPKNTDVIVALAKIEAKQGGNGSVRALIEKALELEPDNPALLGKLGVIHIKEKNYQAALDPLRKLVVLEPENTKARRNLGVAYYHLGDKKNAREEFAKVRQLGGDMDDLYGPLADCYHTSGMGSEAISIVKEGIAKDVQKAWLYCVWGKILEQSKNYDGAISKFVKAVELHEDPWSDYAQKQITRQAQLKKREQMMASQLEMGSP